MGGREGEGSQKNVRLWLSLYILLCLDWAFCEAGLVRNLPSHGLLDYVVHLVRVGLVENGRTLCRVVLRMLGVAVAVMVGSLPVKRAFRIGSPLLFFALQFAVIALHHLVVVVVAGI